jgi:hypothetical protein
VFRVDAVWVGRPSQAAGSDAGDAEGDAVALAELVGAVFEQADKRPVDVAETEEAEIVSADGVSSQGLKPSRIMPLTRR